MPAHSSTEMIDRNKFQLRQLQSRLDRLKKQLARQKEEHDSSSLGGADASPEEILREARVQLEHLQDGTTEPDDPAPRPNPPGKGSRP